MIRARGMVARLRRAPSRIAARLLLFNLLVVFLPVAGLAYLDVYETHLLDLQERAMVQQGRLLAAALADHERLDPVATQQLLDRLGRQIEARLRVIAPDGTLVADSHRLVPPADGTAAAAQSARSGRRSEAPGSFSYRFAAWLARVWREWSPTRPAQSGDIIEASPGRLRGRVIERALAGQYGAATRLSPGGQRSVTLYSAIPVQRGDAIAGAVLVSQSTWRLLQRLYDVRLRMFQVVVVSVAASAILTLLVSTTIVRPLRRLRNEAADLVDRRGRLTRSFAGSSRSDEIGELARALQELTRRLDSHLQFTERFAADVSHEFKNPLASIRSSAEMLAEAATPEDRARFSRRIERDIRRLETLLARVREITEIDALLEVEPDAATDLAELTRQVAAAHRERGLQVTLNVSGAAPRVVGSPERIAQVVDNLLENAASFTSAGGGVEVHVGTEDGFGRVSVLDRGPGVKEEHIGRVFDRFFTYRPRQPDAREDHAGLGLSIAKAIIDAYGGSMRASNRPDGGARFDANLPLASR